MNANSLPWTLPPPLQPRDDRTATGKPRSAIQPADKVELEARLKEDHENTLAFRRGLSALEKEYRDNRNDALCADVDKQSDSWLLDGIVQSNHFADRTLDQIDGITAFMDVLDSDIVRSIPVGITLLNELDEIRHILIWTETTARAWARQFYDEYERRHPDVNDLPFEPMDLGPTNACRLPPVF